jgi:hypothetical protein
MDLGVLLMLSKVFKLQKILEGAPNSPFVGFE